MSIDYAPFDYRKIGQQGTGGNPDLSNARLINYSFDKYQIKVLLGPSNEFLGIVEVGVNKDFRSQQQRLASIGFHDVEQFYRDDTDKP